MMLLFVGLLLVLTYAILYVKANNQCNCIPIKFESTCFKCHKKIEEDYIYCPHCKEQLKKRCENCGSMMDICWRRCPYCQ